MSETICARKAKDTDVVMTRPHARHLFSRKIDDADRTRVQAKCQLTTFLVSRELADNDQFEITHNNVLPYTSFNRSSSSIPSSNVKVASSFPRIIFSVSIVNCRAYWFIRRCSYDVLVDSETYVTNGCNPYVPQATCIMRHAHNR